jgi:hypothetical protein
MKAIIVVYPPFGASIVRRALGLCASDDVRVHGVEERSSVPSAEYWAVRNHNCRVVVVVDADSVNAEIIDGLQGDLEFLLSNRRFTTMHMAVPEVAMVLFHSPEHLGEILGVEVTREELVRAEYVPGEILDSLIARSPCVHSRDELIERIGDEYASRMREHSLMREIECSLARAIAAGPVRTERDYFTEPALLPT